MHRRSDLPLAIINDPRAGRQCQEFPRFLTSFSFFCARSPARRCAPKLRRQKTTAELRFDRGTARPWPPCPLPPASSSPPYPTPSALAARYRARYNDCIMTIAVSIFICGGAEPTRPAARATPRARLLISCLPIFLVSFFLRPPESRASRRPLHPRCLELAIDHVIDAVRGLHRAVD
jgi:hypothetical protein